MRSHDSRILETDFSHSLSWLGAGRAPSLLFMLDAAGRIVAQERALRAALNAQPSLHSGMMAIDFGHLPNLVTALNAALAGADTTLTVTQPGSRVDLSFSPLLNQDGQVVMVQGSLIDVTAFRDAFDTLRDREARLQGVLDTVIEGIIVIDDRGRIESFNKAAQTIFGYSPAEVIGRNVAMLMPASDAVRHDDHIQAYLSGGPAKVIGIGREVEALHRDGGRVPIELAVVEMRQGDSRMFIGSVRDISERKAAEAALRASEERYALAAHGANDGLWDWDLRSGAVYWSVRWAAIIGLAAKPPQPDSVEWLRRVHAEDYARVTAQLDRHLAGEDAFFECEHRLRHEDGRWIWVVARGAAVRDDGGAAIRIAGSFSDVSQRRLTEHRARHDALHDSLTGLPNRNLLLDRIAQRQASGRPFTLVLIDLDRFRILNETLGLGVGDLILTAVARLLRDLCAEDETIARLGGDEFVWLSNETDGAEILSQLTAAIAHTITGLAETDIRVSASFGLVEGDAATQPADLLRDAELAMVQAKHEGGGGGHRFTPALRQQTASLLRAEHLLREALENDGVLVHYQPLVGLADGRLTGFEALVRLRRPDGTILHPVDFIDVAERTGLVVPLGRKVLHAAARQLAVWRREIDPELTVAVNVAARQLMLEGFVGEVETALAESGLDGGLKLEVTEGALIANLEVAATRLHCIRANNIQICIDDFGTGHSSLAYLDLLPIDVLKIDKSFVSSMHLRARRRELTAGIARLALSLDMRIVAEGIETQDQADLLREFGCHYGQGYLFAKPLPPERVPGWLAEHRGVFRFAGMQG